MRERDYERMVPQAMACGYHRTDWNLVTYDSLHKEITWQLLAGDANWKDSEFFSTREQRRLDNLPKWAKEMLPIMDDRERFMRQYVQWLKTSKRLYNLRWEHWSWQIKEDTIQIRWFANRSWENMGMAILERDY